MKKPSTTTTLQTRQKFSCQAWQLVVNKMAEGQCSGSLGNWKVHGNNKYEIASVIKLTFVLPFALQSVNK